MSYVTQYLSEAKKIIDQLDVDVIDLMIDILSSVRAQQGRLFILGVGGSAGNASHAVNDFRKLAGIEAYTPVDNVSELTARTNDEGWETVFSEWLKCSHLNSHDAILILSVGGGNAEKNISANLVEAMKHAQHVKAKILGIVGRDGGFTAKVADAALIIPTVNAQTVTPHAESFQALIWHLIASDERLKKIENKWESTEVYV